MSKVLHCYRRRSGGFTLLEILVAVAVLSIGLLGLAGLQVSGLRFNHSAYLRTQATMLAYELADRMRANSPGFNAGNYDIPSAALGSGVPACDSIAGCSAASMAQNDVFQWKQRLSTILPGLAATGGQGVVCRDTVPIEANSTPSEAISNCNGGPNDPYAIKIWWDDDRTGDEATFKRFVVTLQ